MESDGSEGRTMEGFTRSLPSSPLLNLRLAKRAGRTICCLRQCGKPMLHFSCVKFLHVVTRRTDAETDCVVLPLVWLRQNIVMCRIIVSAGFDSIF